MNKFSAGASNSIAENPIYIGWSLIQQKRSASAIDFKRKVKVYFDRSQYTVKSVENWDELLRALSLREEVFHREFCQDSSRTVSDFDELDISADHLIVVDKASQKVVGNYRLISSRYSHRFYSQGEFFLTEFLQSGGDKLELSRFCVHPAHRSGIVMQLLWRGVIEYMNASNARCLFGCTSVKTVRGDLIAQLASILENQNAFADQYGVEPLPNLRIPRNSESNWDEATTHSAERLMPPLMKAYLRAGARLCRHPALDMDFQCTDFFTILDLEKMSDVYARKFLG